MQLSVVERQWTVGETQDSIKSAVKYVMSTTGMHMKCFAEIRADQDDIRYGLELRWVSLDYKHHVAHIISH